MEKDKLLKALSVLVIGLAAGFLLNFSQSGTVGDGTDWRNETLRDVSTGEKFTVSGLEKPVLVETFAVWCPTCTRQQEEIKKLHEKEGISSVSLDVDPNEEASKVQNHVQMNNFTWRYSIASSGLTRKLVQQYGSSMASPPSTPVVLVCENGSRKLSDGVKTAEKLEQEVEKGC